MNLNEYQKAQIISMIIAMQEITKVEGLNLEYVSEAQMDDLLPFFQKHSKTPLEEQILSIKDIVKQVHHDLTKS